MLRAKKISYILLVIVLSTFGILSFSSSAFAAACGSTFTTPESSTDCTFASGVISVTVDVYGASGADGEGGTGGLGAGGNGGNGQRIIATIDVADGETLQFNVGSTASATTPGASGAGDMDGGAGGVNGGAFLTSSGAGGAASDVRRSPFNRTDTAITAAGGGGGGGASGFGLNGGNGGAGYRGGTAGQGTGTAGTDGGNVGDPGGNGGTPTIASGTGGGGGGGGGASPSQVGNGGGGGGGNGIGTGGTGGTGGNNGNNGSDFDGFGGGLGGLAGILGQGGDGRNSIIDALGQGGGGGGGYFGGGSGGSGGNGGSGRAAGGGGGGGSGFREAGATHDLTFDDNNTGDGFIILSAISSNAPTSATKGSSFSYAPTTFGFTGSGIPDPTTPTWSISSGTLPSGLTLNTSTGEITGIALAEGTFNFVLTASATLPGTEVRESSQSISLVVGAAATTTTSVVAAPSGVNGTLSSTGNTPMPQVIFAATLLVLGSGLALVSMKKRLI
ncbi:MAG: Ig domain-containing protein [Acidimicrobiia bacterium]